MDAAKSAINKLTSNHGKHTTDVTEHYRPAVTHEEIAPTREHQETTVIDSEVHQDHHHTSVLPINHQEVLPTQHKHQLGETKHTEHRHGDHEGIRSKVESELAGFKDTTQTRQHEVTHTAAPTVAGEHHHHHVHETIQPVIQKQTIAPEVVHTTIPVHEVHHSEPKHYTASALPAVSLDEFKKQGGSLTGIADRTERFEGEPENIAKQGHQHGHHDKHGGLGSNTTGSSGLTGSNTTGSSGLTGSHNTGTSGLTGSHNTGRDGLTDSTTTGRGGLNDGSRTHDSSMTGTTGTTGFGDNHNSSTTGGIGERSRAQQAIDSRVDGAHGTGKHDLNTTSSQSTTASKPSLMDRINPFKDSDHDGKKGMMD